MSNTIKDFSHGYTFKTVDGQERQSAVELKIQDWNLSHWDKSYLVAYTFNDYNKEFIDTFVKALVEFKKLRLVTGVTGATMNDIIQSNVYIGVKERLGDMVKTEAESGRYYTVAYELLADIDELAGGAPPPKHTNR